ncbi:acyl-CoA carboxylase subunit epsilon [Tessaracoccus rhinocerotis]|uniref:Acyl-CoA carboxylase subunit epsilon n=1 Tax=Tessaracoccus rhinocerotis TaxID=1689449 RepID=A0A553K504_9ACTN|nr:acyl-CoA carboxylase epsilon subunit [Tessaracoccus rhinocerotis]TRY19790.1 acyl-CoA carboxylase subunit epsilon [Tessaracoccus rhinocerotis]
MSTKFEVIGQVPDDEATAALVALAARAGAPPDEPPTPGHWNSRHRALRVPLPRGRDAWRLSVRTP